VSSFILVSTFWKFPMSTSRAACELQHAPWLRSGSLLFLLAGVRVTLWNKALPAFQEMQPRALLLRMMVMYVSRSFRVDYFKKENRSR